MRIIAIGIVVVIAMSTSACSTLASSQSVQPCGSGSQVTPLIDGFWSGDAQGGRPIVLGGNCWGHSIVKGRVPATFQLAGTEWNPIAGIASPPTAETGSMAYDLRSDQVIMFGGGSRLLPTNETWVWNGSRWYRVEPASSPPARLGSSMAYDPAIGGVVLFGGFSGAGTPLGDTWIWKGTTWTRARSSSSPESRGYAAMTYDPTSEDLVMFGGATALLGAPLDDTWEYSLSGWKESAAGSFGPAACFGSVMAFDPQSNSIILFGGTPGVLGVAPPGGFDDTWRWIGEKWVPVPGKVRPPGRYDAFLAYVASENGLVLYGGKYAQSSNVNSPSGPPHEEFTDMWVFSRNSWKIAGMS